MGERVGTKSQLRNNIHSFGGRKRLYIHIRMFLARDRDLPPNEAQLAAKTTGV
jgi:hypothetical protein